MNYSKISNDIKSIINTLGKQIRIIHKTSGGVTRTSGVWGTIIEGDFNEGNSSIITKKERTIYIPTIKKKPDLSDILIMDNVEYGITKIEIYMPTNIPIAYKITVVN